MVCKSAYSFDGLNKDAYVFNFDLYKYTLDFNSRWTRTGWSVYCVSPLQQLLSWCAVKMRCLIKLQWCSRSCQTQLTIRNWDAWCAMYLLLGRSWEFFSFNPRKLKLTSGWSAESCFKSGRKNSITVLFLSRFIHFTSWHWYQMLYWITCVFYCSRRFFFQQHKPNQLIQK